MLPSFSLFRLFFVRLPLISPRFNVKFMLVKTLDHGKRVLLSLSTVKWLAQDTETEPKKEWVGDKESTLIHHRHRIKIFSICYKGAAYSFPTNLVEPTYPSIYDWAGIFNDYFERINPKVISVFHNAKYDITVFRDQGWKPFKNIWDTAISSWMANANEDKGLKARAPFYGRFIRDTKTINFNDLAELSAYAEGDVVVTDEIYQMHRYGIIRRPKVIECVKDKLGNLEKTDNHVGTFELTVQTEKLTAFERTFLRSQEFPVLRSTIDAIHNGVPLDLSRLYAIRTPMLLDLATSKKAIFRMAGKVINLNSTAQKVEVLQSLGVQISKRSRKTGKFSADYESMLGMSGQHPIIAEMINYSKISKLESVYLGKEGFEYYYNKKTKCIHPSLNTVGAVTGRFSSSNPNCQNVPSRNDRYSIKSCFTAPEGQLFICLDFSQVELRIMAILSQDPLMTKVLNDPKGDIHTTTHQQLGVPRDPVAKQCNFLLIFGGGAVALNQRLRLEGHNSSEAECQAFIDKFDSTYFRVRAFREEAFDFHRRNGFIYLLTGRKRVIENLDSSNRYLRHRAETQLANNVVQGSAQDLMKAVIVRADYRRPNFDKVLPTILKMGKEHVAVLQQQATKVERYRSMFKKANVLWRLQVHDEVLYTAHKADAVEVGHAIADIMTFRHYFEPKWEMSVRIRGDGGVGDTWNAAKKPKDLAFKIQSPLAT